MLKYMHILFCCLSHLSLCGGLLFLMVHSIQAASDSHVSDSFYQQSVLAAKAQLWLSIDRRAVITPITGYKVALAGSSAQAMFGLNSAVVGALFSDTVMKSPQRIDSSKFRRLAFEADLLAVVKSVDINQAVSVETVAENISHIMAFIELPLLSVAPGPFAGPDFIKSNAAVKWGVSGAVLSASSNKAFINSLATMTVESFNAQGELLSSNRGSVIMGHPYNAVLFLLRELKSQNRSLKAGDIISLGSFSKPTLVGSMEQLTVIYSGIHSMGGSTQMCVEVNFTH